MADDLYKLTPEGILDPPKSFKGRLRFLGPGFILSASIVGSGELIATTSFGAEAGFVCLWVIIFSCIVKVTLQLEFGKYAIYSGKTTMEAFNDLPGPRFGRANWTIWSWLLAMTLKFLQVGGIIGLVAMVLNTLMPIGPAEAKTGLIVWTIVSGLAVALLISRGRYSLIEKWCLIMIGLFTIFTIISVVALQWTDFGMSGSELFSGFTFTFPNEVIFIAALAAFGITGVGGDEIMAYNYWLLEKGYASHTGPRPPESEPEKRDEWAERAKGWIRIMTIDAICALICYTLVTALFYILGASVLHRIHGKLPDGANILDALSSMYTESLGDWAKWIFMVGAFIVLFSTLLAALGAWTRMFSDAFSHLGIGNFHNQKSRGKAIAICSFLFPTIWGVLFFVFEKPKFMVAVGGVITAFILVLVVFAALVMRYRWNPPRLRPGKVYDIALWLSSLAITFTAIWALTTGVKKAFPKESGELTALPEAHQLVVTPDQKPAVHHHR